MSTVRSTPTTTTQTPCKLRFGLSQGFVVGWFLDFVDDGVVWQYNANAWDENAFHSDRTEYAQQGQNQPCEDPWLDMLGGLSTASTIPRVLVTAR